VLVRDVGRPQEHAESDFHFFPHAVRATAFSRSNLAGKNW
jgi:hypothetical protein